ncbi:Alpha crystallin/Hsp20 domain [Dillenia turbinata]|uniref:Alpha crystallin/Hsp20 domain n=1 Tax=Dillenia turbinata TaxID=194707 RepID=A0AAN8ZPI7_9MAGN
MELLHAQPQAVRCTLEGKETLLHRWVKHNCLEGLRFDDLINTKHGDEAVNVRNGNGLTALDITQHLPRELRVMEIHELLLSSRVLEARTIPETVRGARSHQVNRRTEIIPLEAQCPKSKLDKYWKEQKDWFDQSRNALMAAASSFGDEEVDREAPPIISASAVQRNGCYQTTKLSALQHALDERSDNAPTKAYVRDANAVAATPADVKEYSDSYVIIVDMPGLKSGNVKVQVENDNMLVISGERKREEEKDGVKYLRMERRVGKFMRKFALPENANVDDISAVCQDGVLTVTVKKLPPPEPKKPKTIEVKIA